MLGRELLVTAAKRLRLRRLHKALRAFGVFLEIHAYLFPGPASAARSTAERP
jgi:hypothetical protein